MKVFNPKTSTAIKSLKKNGLILLFLGLSFYLISEWLEYPKTSIPFVPGFEIVLIIQGLGFFWKIRKIKKEEDLLKNYAISISETELHFPKYYSDQDAPEITGENLKIEKIALSNIKNFKVSFGIFVIKKKEPSWADELKFPAYYFSKNERKEILSMVRSSQNNN